MVMGFIVLGLVGGVVVSGVIARQMIVAFGNRREDRGHREGFRVGIQRSRNVVCVKCQKHGESCPTCRGLHTECGTPDCHNPTYCPPDGWGEPSLYCDVCDPCDPCSEGGR